MKNQLFFIFLITLFINATGLTAIKNNDSVTIVKINTSYGAFIITKKEVVKISQTFNNKKQTVESVREVYESITSDISQIKMPANVLKELEQYRSYEEDVQVTLIANNVGKLVMYKFENQATLNSLNDFYKKLFDDILKKALPAQVKQLINLPNQNTLKITMTYKK